MSNNCSCPARSNVELVLQGVTLFGTLMATLAPYLLKTRPVQERVFARRVEKKREMRDSMRRAVDSLNVAIASLGSLGSSRSDSEKHRDSPPP